MNVFHRIIYTGKVNRVVRSINYFLAPILPSKIKIHPSGKLRLHLKDGTTFSLKTNQTSFLTRELFWKKPENFEYTSIFVGLISKLSYFLDIGANIGYYSILGCRVNPELKAYAFEPSIGAMVYMGENIKINDLTDRIIAEPIALSDKVGEIDFYEMKNLKFPKIYNLSGEHNIGTKSNRTTRKFKVKSTTLDNYISEKKLECVDLMKLDTEGAEGMILKGAENTLEKNRPIVICETLFDKIEGELENIMSKYDYDFYNHTDDGLKKVNSITRIEDDGIRNCFFVPKNKVHLIEEWVI